MDLFGEANVAMPDMVKSVEKEILAYVLVSMAALGFGVWRDLRRGSSTITLVVLAVVCGVFLPFARWRVKSTFEACVANQAAAIAKFKPTHRRRRVVVGWRVRAPVLRAGVLARAHGRDRSRRESARLGRARLPQLDARATGIGRRSHCLQRR